MAGVGRYAVGVAGLLLIGGSLALAAVALRRRTMPDWTGAPARLAETVVGLALLIGSLEVLGAVGLFAFAPIVIACGCLGFASLGNLASRRIGGRGASGPDSPSSASVGPGGPVRSRSATTTVRLTTVLAVLAGATVIAEWGALSIQSYDVGIRGFDSLWYHLPWAASFAQTGNVVSLRFTDVEYLTPFYPGTAEMLHGLGIVLLGRDMLSPGLNLVWLALALLAAYCIGRPRGVGPATLLGAALALACTMMDYSQAGAAANDVVAIFFVLASVALFVNGSLVLAAVAAGLAVGVKLTVLAAVLALTVGVIATAPRGRRLATTGRWLGPLVLAGGFWYLRNLIAVGNPLPWSSLADVLPTPSPPLQQHTGYSVAHYLTSAGFWSHFAEPALAAGLGRWWWAVLAVAVVGPALCLVQRSPGRNVNHVDVSSRATLRMLGAVALVSLAAYLVTPETAAGPAGDPLGFAFNLRYLAPALTLSLAVAPLAPLLSSPRARTATVIALAVILAATVIQPRLWPSAHLAGAIAIGVAALALLALARTRTALLAAAAVALVIAGYPLQTHYLRGRYVYHPNVSSLAPIWAQFRTIHHARVGVVGTFGGFFSYPLYGLDDDEPRPVRRPARPPRLVHGNRHLRSMASPGELRALEISHHHTRTRPVAPEGAQPVAGDRLDGLRSGRSAGVPRDRPGSTDRGLPDPRPARPRRVRVSSTLRMSTATDPLADPELLETEWDLSPLLEGGGEERAGAVHMLDEARDRAAKFAALHAGKVAELDQAGLHDAMRELEAINELIGRVGSYASLRFAVDTADPARGALLQLVQERATEVETLLLFFELEWAALDDNRAEELVADARLDFCRHHLRSVRRYRSHLLSENEEKVIAEKAISSQAAWNRLFGELVAALRVPLDGQELTLDVALSRLQQADRDVRRAAADAVSNTLEPGARTRGFIYNTLIYDKSVEDRLRRYPHWLASRNLANEASDESVIALIHAVRARFDIPQRWYRLKAKLLGIDKLADYDRSAPVEREDVIYSFAQARDLVLDTYHSFSPVAGDVAQRFFAERWIDAPPRPHKRGGAFCAYTVPSVHPYVLLNFTAQRRDVLTMAHELGHGLHAALAQPQGVFHQSTPLTLAETASVFGEALVFGRMLADAEDREQRLGLLAERIDGAIATVFRQMAMNRFEHLVHTRRRAEGELSTDRICESWVEAQGELFGDSVEITNGYRLWWSYVPHFINTPGYVYAYAYGLLLALSVYSRYLEHGDAFVPSYLELLSSGGSRSPEQLTEIVGIDLSDPGFWDSGLALVEQQLTEAEDLAG